MEYKENNRLWRLIARRTAGEILPEEEQELNGLLQEYPYAHFFEEMLQEGDWVDKYKAYSKADIERFLQKNKEKRMEAPLPEKKRTLIPLFWYGAAAAAMLLIWWTWNSRISASGEAPAEIQLSEALATPKGKRSKLTLPDGSIIWLNAASKLEYSRNFKGKNRVVRLEGEAYFEITKDSTRPFYVYTNSFNIKVLGTGFNVRAYPDEDSAITSLIHGSVEIFTGAGKGNSILLKPNEKIILPTIAELSNSTQQVGGKPTVPQRPAQPIPEPITVMQDSVLAETAWINSTLAFKKMPLEQVALLLEKWFGAEIRFKNESKKKLRFTGVFKGEQLEDVLLSLEATGSFRYSKDAGGTIWIE